MLQEQYDRSRPLSSQSLGNLLYNLPNETKCLIRKLEKLYIKDVHSSLDALFNSTCIKENLLPSYTDIRNSDPTVRYEDCNLNFRMEFLKENLKKCEEEQKTAEQNAKLTEQEVRNKLKN